MFYFMREHQRWLKPLKTVNQIQEHDNWNILDVLKREKTKEKSLLVETLTTCWTAVQLAVQLRSSLNPGTGVSEIHVVDQIKQRQKKKKKRMYMVTF